MLNDYDEGTKSTPQGIVSLLNKQLRPSPDPASTVRSPHQCLTTGGRQVCRCCPCVSLRDAAYSSSRLLWTLKLMVLSCFQVPLAAVQKMLVRMEAPVSQVPMPTAVTAGLGSKADTVSLPVKKCPAPAHGCSLRPSHFLSGKATSATMCIRKSTKFTRTCALRSAARAQASGNPNRKQSNSQTLKRS